LTAQFLNQRRNLGVCPEGSRWQKSHIARQKPAKPRNMTNKLMAAYGLLFGGMKGSPWEIGIHAFCLSHVLTIKLFP
jgi:hypothetical protein